MNVSNSSKNATRGMTPFVQQLTTTDIILVIIFSFIFLFGSVGNGIIIYVYKCVIKNKLSKYESLILILSIADFLASIVNPFTFVYLTLTNYKKWHFGEVGCKLILTTGPVISSFSCGIILILSIDRDRAIVSPIKKPFTKATIYWAVFITFLLSTTNHINYAWHLVVTRGRCIVNGNKIYNVTLIVSFLISVLSFTVIFLTTFLRIYFKLRQCSALLDKNNPLKQIRHKRAAKAVRVVFLMGVIFILFVFPRSLFHICFSYTQIFPPSMTVNDITLAINAYLKALYTSSSCVNVCIYSLFNAKFRKAVRAMFSTKSTNLKQLELRIGKDCVTSECDYSKGNSKHRSRTVSSLVIVNNYHVNLQRNTAT